MEVLNKRASQKNLTDFSVQSNGNEDKKRMFEFVARTWNPVIGCEHDCSYCWARRLVNTRLKGMEKYKDGLKPKLVEHELSRRFKKGKTVFVTDMGDLWGSWVPSEWILRVLDAISKSPEASFLFLTKNPARYLDFLDVIPENAILGATIETNRNTTAYSKPPLPEERLKAMRKIRHRWRNAVMVTIEPVMEFDFSDFLSKIKEIEPDFVVIGKDNYGNNLPEPSLRKVLAFTNELERFTKVVLKGDLNGCLAKRLL